MDSEPSENRSRQPPLDAKNINDMNTHSSPSPVCRRYRSALACGSQLCGGVVLPPHPWAPKRKHVKRKLSRMSYRRGGPLHWRNLFGPDEVAAVDTDGLEIPHQAQRHTSLTFSTEDYSTDNVDNSHRIDDTNNENHVVKYKSDDECNILDVECEADSKNVTCDADRHVLLPKPQLLVFNSTVHKPFLSPVNDFSTVRNTAEEVSSTRCSRLLIVSARKRLSPSNRVCLIPQPRRLAFASGVQKQFPPAVNDYTARNSAEDCSYTGCAASRIVSARKRLPSSKRAKLARMDRQCLRFGRFDEGSGPERMCEDASLASPSVSFSRLCLSSPAQTPRRPNKPSRRRLFGNEDSDTYFYDISTSSHCHQGQSYDKKTTSIELNSLFSACSGQLRSNSYRDK
ncbi:hypothetical protein BsWGS_28064 [Bradybaena similaris]